ncbi:MAG: hypothetical protein M1396_03280 [Chloroflexi bacterium]|nr:hypothetical protein [Chloroflexota bacterium]
MAHGTKLAEGQLELLELERLVAQRVKPRPAALGVLEYPSDLVASIEEAAGRLAATQPHAIIAIPVLLLRAGHGKIDMPTQVAHLRAHYPSISWHLAAPLLPHPSLLQVAQERLAAACDDYPWSSSIDAVLFVGRGSHDPTANADLFKIARLFTERYRHSLVEACFISQARPGVPEGIRRCVALGARSIAILPYFLHDGILPRRILEQTVATQRGLVDINCLVTQRLGNHPLLIDLLLLRAREAFYHTPAFTCLADREPQGSFGHLWNTVPTGSNDHGHTHATPS